MTIAALTPLPPISPRAPKANPSRQLAWQRKMREQGRCRRCAEPAAGHAHCENCLAAFRDRYAAKRPLLLKQSADYRARTRPAFLAYMKVWNARKKAQLQP